MREFVKKGLTILVVLISTMPIFSQNKYEETDAVVLQNGCALWTLDDEGNAVSKKETLDAGTEIKVLAMDNKPRVESLTYVSQRSTQTGRFVKITYIDDEYYILDGRIAIGMVPGIITVPSAAVYRTKNLADIRNVCLYSGRVVAVGGSYEVAGSISMSEVAYFDSDDMKVRRGYVRADRVSANRDDIIAIDILNTVNRTAELSKRRQLVLAAKDLNVSGNVLEMIGEAEMKVRRSSDLSLSGQTDVRTQTFYYAENGSYVYIRDMPSTSGNVVGTLSYEEDFTVIRRTARSQTLYGINDFWYYGVSENKLDGWVFGGFLTPRPREEDENEFEMLMDAAEEVEAKEESNTGSATTTSEESSES